MSTHDADVVIVGGGPVGLMCAYLGRVSGLRTVVLDQSEGPVQVGRADALNARSLQLLETVGLFNDLYKLGKTCNTSSVFSGGQFISRQSKWWDELEGCFHKHFLMLGQTHLEHLLDQKIRETGEAVRRSSTVVDISVSRQGCVTTLANGEVIRSKYVIGADGSRSFVRELFQVGFEVVRPQIVWAVIDGVIESDFPKVPDIIVFQADTSDVAWIPREGNIDRFYVRMDTKDFSFDQALTKINRAVYPYRLRFQEIQWQSQFTVKESVAEKFSVLDRVFLAGDACHVHSVNGGQGLNTGLGDAFNLMWKLGQVENFGVSSELLKTYEGERKPIALGVVETSGELVRSTKHSATGTHAQDYVKIVERRSGYVTGMGVRYGDQGISGSRLHDLEIYQAVRKTRLYSLLDYSRFTLLAFTDQELELKLPPFVNLIQVRSRQGAGEYWTENPVYANQFVLVRPDSYIESVTPAGVAPVENHLSS